MENEVQEKAVEEQSTETKDSKQNSLLYVLRWLVLLPASITVAYLVLYTLIISTYTLITEEIIERSQDSIGIAIAFFIFGFFFVFLGVTIAPKYKKVTAYALFSIPSIFVCIFLGGSTSKIFSVLYTLAGGVFAAVIFPLKLEEKMKKRCKRFFLIVILVLLLPFSWCGIATIRLRYEYCSLIWTIKTNPEIFWAYREYPTTFNSFVEDADLEFIRSIKPLLKRPWGDIYLYFDCGFLFGTAERNEKGEWRLGIGHCTPIL